MNYRESDRLPSYRFYRALQRQKSPMRYICEIFGARDFRVFQHNLPQPDMTTAVVEDWFARSSGVSDGIIGVTVWAVAAGFISEGIPHCRQ
jgi:hypothetical protein